MFSPRLPVLAVLSLLSARASAAFNPSIAGDTKFWKLDESHSDEFSSAGAVDAKKWSQELGAWTGTAPGVFKKENAAVTVAKELVLTTREEEKVAYKKIFDGECQGKEIMMYYHVSQNNENPGKTPEERVQKCAEKCDGAVVGGVVAKGFAVTPGAGVCWCEDQDATTCKRILDPTTDNIGYDRYNYVKSTKSTDTCGTVSTPLVVSSGTLSFGFYEIRAKMAKASLLSSFFLQSTSGGGEISIVDAVPASKKSGLKVSNSYHCFNPADGATTKSSEMKIKNLDPSDGYHTYGVERATDGAVKFYVDGALVRTLTPKDAVCLLQPMKVVFSMVVDNGEGLPSDFNPYTSHVDYFRHWTHAAAPALVWFPRVAKDDGSLTWAQAQGICQKNSRQLCAMSEVCPKGPGSAMVGLALGKYGWFPAADDSAKKNNWAFGIGGQGPAVSSCALHHETNQYKNLWPAWGNTDGWPDDTAIPCCKKSAPGATSTACSKLCGKVSGCALEGDMQSCDSTGKNSNKKACIAYGVAMPSRPTTWCAAKSGKLVAGDDDPDYSTATGTATGTATQPADTTTGAEVARTVFLGIIAAAFLVVVYMHASGKVEASKAAGPQAEQFASFADSQPITMGSTASTTSTDYKFDPVAPQDAPPARNMVSIAAV